MKEAAIMSNYSEQINLILLHLATGHTQTITDILSPSNGGNFFGFTWLIFIIDGLLWSIVFTVYRAKRGQLTNSLRDTSSSILENTFSE